jgi:hypothetical protein
MGYLYQQVCSIFKYESFNTTQQAFHSIINEKKDVLISQLAQEITYLSRRYRSYSM